MTANFKDPLHNNSKNFSEIRASQLLKVYQDRTSILGSDLFRSPAWEILINLRVCNAQLSCAEIALAVRISDDTCRRWLQVLAKTSHVEVFGSNESEKFAISMECVEKIDKILSNITPIFLEYI